MDRDGFPTITQLLNHLEGGSGEQNPGVLTASDVDVLVDGWKHVRPNDPTTYNPSALFFDDFRGEKRDKFDKVQEKLREPGCKDPLEDEGGVMLAGVKPLFGLTPRAATRLVLTGRF